MRWYVELTKSYYKEDDYCECCVFNVVFSVGFQSSSSLSVDMYSRWPSLIYAGSEDS